MGPQPSRQHRLRLAVRCQDSEMLDNDLAISYRTWILLGIPCLSEHDRPDDTDDSPGNCGANRQSHPDLQAN